MFKPGDLVRFKPEYTINGKRMTAFWETREINPHATLIIVTQNTVAEVIELLPTGGVKLWWPTIKGFNSFITEYLMLANSNV